MLSLCRLQWKAIGQFDFKNIVLEVEVHSLNIALLVNAHQFFWRGEILQEILFEHQKCCCEIHILISPLWTSAGVDLTIVHRYSLSPHFVLGGSTVPLPLAL